MARSADGAGAAGPSTPWLTRTWQTDEGLPDNNITGNHVATIGGNQVVAVQDLFDLRLRHLTLHADANHFTRCSAR